VAVLLVEEVRVAELLPDGVRVLVTDPVGGDDAEGERLPVELRDAIPDPLAVLEALVEPVDVLDAEEVREADGEPVAVDDDVDVREAEGELVVVRDEEGLRVPDTEPVGVCDPELDFVADDEPVADLVGTAVRVDVTDCRGDRVPVDVRVDVTDCRGDRVPVDVRVEVIVGGVVLVVTADRLALCVVTGVRVSVADLLDVRDPELDFVADGEAVVVREPEDVFVVVRVAVDVIVGIAA
jgi:hypothetical protein